MPTNEDAREQYRRNEMSFQLNFARGLICIGALLLHASAYASHYFRVVNKYKISKFLDIYDADKFIFIFVFFYIFYIFEQAVECSVRDKLGGGGVFWSKLRLLAVLIIYNLIMVFEYTTGQLLRYFTIIPFDTTLSVCLFTLILLPITKLPFKWHIIISVMVMVGGGILYCGVPITRNISVNQLFWAPFQFIRGNEDLVSNIEERMMVPNGGIGAVVGFVFFQMLGRLYYEHLKKHTVPYRFSYMRYSDSGNKFTKRILWLGKNASNISLVRLIVYPTILMIIFLITFGRL